MNLKVGGDPSSLGYSYQISVVAAHLEVHLAGLFARHGPEGPEQLLAAHGQVELLAEQLQAGAISDSWRRGDRR
jgi:hypothetical protein